MAIERIRDLPLAVTAAKADWIIASTWMGFTPREGTTEARGQCQSTVVEQMGKGLVLEFITLGFGKPNDGFASNPKYLSDRVKHRAIAGRLIALHRLRPSARPLLSILGHEEFDDLQKMWSVGPQGHRWSVAFPIIDTYEIVQQPLVTDIFPQEVVERVFYRQSSTLRRLGDAERVAISDLEIRRRPATNAWIGIEDEFPMAEQSEIPARTKKSIDGDLVGLAVEGLTSEQIKKVRLRAAWLADLFARGRARSGKLRCDECGFDPIVKAAGTSVRPRSLLDVHHRHPLEEGVRYTVSTDEDFALLCPTCHRFAHAVLAGTK